MRKSAGDSRAAIGGNGARPRERRRVRLLLSGAPGRQHALGAEAYPITSFTWLLIPSKIADATKRQALVDFLKWMLKDGQKLTEALSYAHLPTSVVAKEEKAISLVTP